MPMTVVVTRDVPDRMRGFLASCMLEIAPGVYTQPRMSAGVRARVWSVLEDWHTELRQGAVVMTWPDADEPCGQAIRTLGVPPRRLVEIDGLVVAARGPAVEQLPEDSEG